ncbi:AMP-binding protein [Actinoalloteichus caeruleus]|uniref:NrpS n=3 Tax=Actinoalloteichus cyanogriseus TaxID=2893586 RepID=M1F381_ACTCY|nr:AMP-binding protein [Actinoalloteichus caeruleus]AFK24513.1 NrpS [Actinoalloteichus caeruleus]
MEELRRILTELGVEEQEIAPDLRLRAHLALDSTETVELEARLGRDYGIVVDLWDAHDYTLGELSARIEAAGATPAAGDEHAAPAVNGGGAPATDTAAPGGDASRTGEDGLVRISPARAAEYRSAGYWIPRRVDQIVLDDAPAEADQVALVAGERRLTRGELRSAVSATVARLTALGVRAGDMVVVQLPNEPELVVLALALSRIGATPIMTPIALRHYELDHVVRTARPVAIAVPRRHTRFDHLAMAQRLREEHACLGTVLLSGEPDPSCVDLAALCAPAEDGAGGPAVQDTAEPAPDLDRAALCLLSSGTTGPPKVIPRLQEAYGYQLRHTPALAGVGPESVYLAVMPATHGFVLGCPGVLGTLAAGGRVVLGASTEPEQAFALVERERVTHTTLVPALVERWVDAGRATTHDLSSLRVLQVGGARPRRGQVEEVPAVLGCQVQQCYGMSEGLLCYTALDDTDEVVFDTQGRPASPADEIRVVDDAGDPVPPGELGALLTRGPYTVAGYYGDEESNASTFTADGFYRTGDLVRVHPSGSLIVEGRNRDVINRGGEKISAVELELMAAEHPSIASAAAVAGPHPRYGEEVCLFVVADGTPPTLVDVRRYLVHRGLARYKLPERLEFVDALPYLGIGKVDKKRLRALAAEDR